MAAWPDYAAAQLFSVNSRFGLQEG